MRVQPHPSTRGFTLIELMLVVTLLAIIFAIAVPALVDAKKRANESSAIATLRNLSTAETQYRIRFGTYGALGDLVVNGSVDDALSDGEKSGYLFVSSAPDPSTWSVTASPSASVFTGDRFFLVDESGVIRFSETGAPTSADAPID